MYQLLKKIKPLITNTGPKIKKDIQSNFFLRKKNILHNIELSSFGQKNSHKFFYVIKRSPGSGFFSNFVYVINHIRIAKIYNLIPIIDMQNYKTIYNDDQKLKKINAWNYYFQNINQYKLSEVYKSKNVLFSSNIFDKKKYFHLPEINRNLKLKNEFKKIKNKHINVNNNIKKKSEIFLKKFKNYKILGIHLRGTSYKNAPKHHFPIPDNLGIEICKKLIQKYKYDKIFLITEELKYLEKYKNIFGEKLIFYDSFRSYKNDAFKIYPRKLHRYKLGEEILIETLILSNCDGIISNLTNVSSAGIFLSKKKNLIHNIFLGYNSPNKFLASFLWYIKKNLPSYFFGFNVKIN